MEIVDMTKKDEKFINYFNKNSKEIHAKMEENVSDYVCVEYPIRFNTIKKKWWDDDQEGSIARANIIKNNVDIILRKIRIKTYNFEKFKNILKDYEKMKKAKITLKIVNDY